ncbi:ABC1 kinase family protein [Roseimaritima sediminicola]|uniref:ABC1 kinase family protein n=1 Tax=Roseimaritima sediminicola TaxID=2662066 RepID=UPI001298461C|nr:AarF/UbiB family protein [Roseimaritima sediminicola]
MKITAIPQLYRNLKRWRQILQVLRRYGLADWLSHFPSLPFRDFLKDRQGVPLTQHSREKRVRLALTELGPTFIKLGQLLAARPDLVGASMADELKLLRANVAPDPPEVVRRTLHEELGERFEHEIAVLEDQPLATASIGQVHAATLADGRQVVIKVQRDGVEHTILQDLDVLAGLAQLAEHVEAFAPWGPAEMARQMMPMLRHELDFEREQQNMQVFDQFFADDPDVVLPEPVAELCTARVLVMTRLDGPNVAKWEEADPEKRNQMAQNITRCYMRMLFDHGTFHADPHPGNLLALADGKLGILDFGMVGRVDDRLRETIEEMLFAIAAGDEAMVLRLVKRVGNPPPCLDDAALSVDIGDYLATYGRQGLGKFNLTAALNDLTDILHRHNIKLPSQSALLLKMLVSLEGTLSTLNAQFDSLSIIRGFVRQAMLRRLSPKRRFRQARRIYLEAENFLEFAPDQVLSLLEQARRGNVSLNLEHRRLSPSVNRLVLGMLASSLFLGSSLMLAMKVPPLLFPSQSFLGIHQLSVLGTAGAGFSLMVMMRLALAIGHSGHLTRDNDD